MVTRRRFIVNRLQFLPEKKYLYVERTAIQQKNINIDNLYILPMLFNRVDSKINKVIILFILSVFSKRLFLQIITKLPETEDNHGF